MTHYHYLIIGGGMSAGAALEGIRTLDKDGTIGLLTAEADSPYARPPLSKGLWKGEKTLPEIQFTVPAGTTVHTACQVATVHIAEKSVTDVDGNEYSYEKLLVATGGTPKRLPAATDDQILYYRTLQDYRRLRALTERYRSFVVIGGSFIGSEIAAALRLNDKDVTLLFPEESICAHLFPRALSGYLNRYYESKGVHVHPATKINAVDGTLGNYTLHTEQRTTIEAEVIVAGLGIEPNIALAAEAGLQVDHGILVNKYLQTSAPAIYAAGDAVRFKDALLDQWRRVEHEDNAVTMGKAAGRAMAGANEPYTYSPMFYSDLFDLGYEAVGELHADMATYVDWQEEFQKGVVYYLKDNYVRGVLLWNVWDQVGRARELIAANKPMQPQELQGRIT